MIEPETKPFTAKENGEGGGAGGAAGGGGGVVADGGGAAAGSAAFSSAAGSVAPSSASPSSPSCANAVTGEETATASRLIPNRRVAFASAFFICIVAALHSDVRWQVLSSGT